MLPHFESEHRLLAVDLVRRRQHHGLDSGLFEALCQVHAVVRNLPLLGELGGVGLEPAGQGDDLDVGHLLQRFDVREALGPLSCQTDLHPSPFRFLLSARS